MTISFFAEERSIKKARVLESCRIFHSCFVLSTVERNLAVLDFSVVLSSNSPAISEAYKNKNDELNDLILKHDLKKAIFSLEAMSIILFVPFTRKNTFCSRDAKV